MGNICFGVQEDDDAKFGLSPYQWEHDCTPQLLADSHPGTHYLDVGQIKPERKVMRLRTWHWGEDSSLMATHAQRYNTATRPLDQVTTAALAPPPMPMLGGGDRPPNHPQDGNPLGNPPAGDDNQLPTTRPTTRLVSVPAGPAAQGGDMLNREGPPIDHDTTGLTNPIGPTDDTRNIVFTAPPSTGGAYSPDEALAAFRTQLHTWLAEGKTSFAIEDCATVLGRTGRSRPWLYDALDRLQQEGAVTKHSTFPTSWGINAAAQVPG